LYIIATVFSTVNLYRQPKPDVSFEPQRGGSHGSGRLFIFPASQDESGFFIFHETEQPWACWSPCKGIETHFKKMYVFLKYIFLKILTGKMSSGLS